MKETTKALIFIIGVSIALMVTGCVQNSPATSGNTGIQESQAATSAPGQHQGPSQNGVTPPAGIQRQYQGQGQRPLPNATVLAGAAEKLGVTEPQLENALTSPSGERVNFTAAAQQLGVTPRQLAGVLGVPGSPIQHNNTSPQHGYGMQ